MLRSALLLCTFVHLFCIGWTISLPMGQLIPPWAICFHVPAMVLMAFSHALHHMGARQSLAFFALVTAVEWSWEQLNASFGGFIFGPLAYHDTLIGPKLMDIPVIVPLAYAAIAWPATAMVNVMLHDHPVVRSGAHEPLLHFVWRCAIVSTVHTAWSFGVEPLCIKFGAMHYTDHPVTGTWQPGTFWGVPFTEFRGWWLMALFALTLHGRLVAPRLPLPPAKALDLVIDSTPCLLYGGFAAWLVVRAIDPVAGAFSLFTMGLCIVQAGYKTVVLCAKDAAGGAKSKTC